MPGYSLHRHIFGASQNRRFSMLATFLYGPRDVRLEEVPYPRIIEPPDALIRVEAACVCGSDLWPYRGIQPITKPMPMGHEYCGFVEAAGRSVTPIRPGAFLIGPVFAS